MVRYYLNSLRQARYKDLRVKNNSGNNTDEELDNDEDANKLLIGLKVELIRILRIEEVQFKLEVVWQDSRLEFWNLKEDGNISTLTEK